MDKRLFIASSKDGRIETLNKTSSLNSKNLTNIIKTFKYILSDK